MIGLTLVDAYGNVNVRWVRKDEVRQVENAHNGDNGARSRVMLGLVDTRWVVAKETPAEILADLREIAS